MRSTRRTGVLALAASLVLTAGAVTVVLPASADPIQGPVGQLVLKASGSTNTVSYEGSVQTLSTKENTACDLASSGPALLSFKGTAGPTDKPIGFRDNGIGVIETTSFTNSLSLCNQVDAVAYTKGGVETLKVALGTDLKFNGQPVLASKASLDLEVRAAGLLLKSPAKIQITAINSTTGETVASLDVAQGTAPCPVTTTNGVNCQVTVEPVAGKYFDTLLLKANKGAFSLEGGSDAGTKATTFDLVSEVDTVFACTGTPPLEEGNTSVKYLGNADRADPCVTGFGAILTPGDTEVILKKPLTVNPSAQFVFDIDWKVDNSDGTPSPTIPDTIIDFEIGGDPEETPLLFCSESDTAVLARNATTGDLEIVNFAKFNEDDTAFPDFDGDSLEQKEFACIDTRTEIGITPEFVTYTDKVFAIGDLRMKAGG